MESLFIITSAIYTSYGNISTKDRIEQTKETIESIKKYAPNSKIVLLECGERSLDENLFDCKIIDYANNLKIKSHRLEYLRSSKDVRPEIILKSMLEILITNDYLKSIHNNPYERIFKLCGRYKLNSKFNFKTHLLSKNKMIILKPTVSQHLYRNEKASSILTCSTRFFSFDCKLLNVIIEMYDKMEQEILFLSKFDDQVDIEHLFYKHLNKKIVNFINKIGIDGYWSPEKYFIEE